jgi:hypothetical protein
LLSIAQGFFKCGKCRVIQNLNARAWVFVYLNTVDAGVVIEIGTAFADRPDLTGLKWVIAYFVVRSQLVRADKVLFTSFA